MKRAGFLLISIFATVAAFAQNSLTVDAPGVVSTDENFRVVFTADGKMSDFNWPGSEHFTVLWGPQTGSMSSVSIVNGKRTSVHQETRTYILQANSTGKFSLPAATATIGKQEYTTGAFSIEVVGENPQQGAAQPAEPEDANQSAQSQQSRTGQPSSQVGGKDIFLSLTVNKSSVVKGEPLIATLKLYTRVDIQGFEDVRFPTFDGFWSKEIASPQNIEFNRENVGGTIYNSALIRRYMLIPQHTGKVTIQPAEMVCLVRIMTGSASGSFFDSFFDTYQTVRKRLVTPNIAVNVRPLPPGAPMSFGGGVGDFRMDVSLGNENLKSNEAGSLIVKISGKGNISMLETPRISFPADFEVYDVKTSENISADGTSGTKTFEYPFIPRSHGEFNMDPIQYSYYDISKGRYNTLESRDMVLNVEKGQEVDGGGVVMPGVSKHGVKNLAEDIRFIAMGNPALHQHGKFFAGSPLFWGLLALSAVLFFLISLLLGRLEARRRDVAGIRTRRADKMARARLRVAADYLKRSLNSAYYEELHKAVLGYISDKMSIPSADLSRERISECLAERGIDTALAERLLHIIDACEFARYAPDTAQAEKEDLYNESVNVISELEGKMKRNISSKKGTASVMAAMLLATSALNASAQDAGELWQTANEQYTAGEYAAAGDSYKAIEAMGLESEDLYYNIANCHFKMGDIPHAILYYEKCLKIDPSHSDALHNVAIARQMTLDKIDEIPQFFILTWIENLEYAFSPDGWAWITLALALVIVALMLCFRFLPSEAGRKVSFIFACIVFVLASAALAFSLDEKSDALRSDGAVMIQPVSSVKSSPGDAGKSIFVLHEGTVIKVLDNLGDWTKIELSDGRQGWVETVELEVI